MPGEKETHIALLGIDCAVDPQKMGLAAGVYQEGEVRVTCVSRGDEFESVLGNLDPSLPLLVAIDSPLGWPAALGRAIAPHMAGQPIGIPSGQLFRRDTDRTVKELIGKRPLEVGADRIARTALRALELLQQVGDVKGVAPTLVWSPEEIHTVHVIEVYPAATLKQHGLPAAGYKKSNQRSIREEQLRGLSKRVFLECPSLPLLDDADCLDAVVCLLTAKDFLTGKAIAPLDKLLAEKEGWIWFSQTYQPLR